LKEKKKKKSVTEEDGPVTMAMRPDALFLSAVRHKTVREINIFFHPFRYKYMCH